MRRRFPVELRACAIFLVSILILSGLTAAGTTAEPRILAVKFHADWCGSCKKMGSAFEDLRNKFDGRPVLFVELDRTNLSSSHQAALLASALRLGEVFDQHAGTGFILLLDGDSREIVAKLTADKTMKEMAAEIEAKLSA